MCAFKVASGRLWLVKCTEVQQRQSREKEKNLEMLLMHTGWVKKGGGKPSLQKKWTILMKAFEQEHCIPLQRADES